MNDADKQAVMIALMKSAGVEVPSNRVSDVSAEALNCLAVFVQIQDQTLELAQRYLTSLVGRTVSEGEGCECSEDDAAGCAIQQARKIITIIESMRDDYMHLLRLPPEALA